MTDLYIFDCETFAHDWLFVFKHVESGEYAVIHNDNIAVREFMKQDPLLCGFNNKHFDRFILAAVCNGAAPDEVKQVSDFIVAGNNGWDYHDRELVRFWFRQFDVFDDCQIGLSLKAIEAHMGMSIRETTVSFDLDRALTDEELEEVIHYCKYDVDATEKLMWLRKDYLGNKLMLGDDVGVEDDKALYMTNAKLTAAYLDASPQPHEDERKYVYPDNLLREYIPVEVFEFFDRLHDPSIPDSTVFSEQLKIMVGDSPCTIGYGGIHAAIPTYKEESTETRSIRNQDVASYYPNLMIKNGYCSRNIPSPSVFEEVVKRRIQAKKSGDKPTANALKLVANTTYGAMLNRYNDLYDPLMGRSVCISGQLYLLELANHLLAKCPSLRVIQINTDGLMVSLDDIDLPAYKQISSEWESRTSFELEEDLVQMICQKDVNNYVEVTAGGEVKMKGVALVRGISPAGAFNINNNARIVAQAVAAYLTSGTSVDETILSCDVLQDFQLVAKASGKYAGAFHLIDGELTPVQRVNRVYATNDKRYGTLLKLHKNKENPDKIAGLPPHCVVDNENLLNLEVVDKDWYIALAKKYINDFLGIKPPKKNTRKINSIKKKILKILEE